MSKRSYRRIAVLAGTALAVGSMAPAMAARIDATGGAGAEIDPALVINDVTNIAGSLPLPALPTLPAVPSITQVNSTIITTGGIAGGLGLLAFGGTNGILGTTFAGLNVLGGNLLGGLPLGGLLGGLGGILDVSASGNVGVLSSVLGTF